MSGTLLSCYASNTPFSFSLVAGVLVNAVGYSSGSYGTVDPSSPTPASGKTVLALSYDSGTDELVLAIDCPSNPGSSWLKYVNHNGTIWLQTAVSTYAWEAFTSNLAQWIWSSASAGAMTNGVRYQILIDRAGTA